ncbi:hypothetical protein QZH41_012318 [Actinostola sp. cb2023]|nr:hypothetical protein QZH41_012318 [Actinostola sp. cb2023]
MSDREMEMMPKETGDNFDRTVHAKNQYIKTLEDDLKNIRQHTTTQSDRYQKKLKKLRGTLSKSRQDSSLKLFELKDENTKLTEKNTKLQEHIERLSMDSGDSSRQGSASSDRSLQQSHDKTINDDSNDHHDDPRMKLILELSEQVTNLDAENFKLKQELRHCRKIAEKVEKVRMQTKKSSGRTADIVVVEKSQSSWKALESSSSRLEIGEQA